jgi:hypothetical protein
LERQKGRKAQLEETVVTVSDEIKLKDREYRQYEKAREIIREIGIKMQEQLTFHISAITSLALEAVFDEPYTLEVEFIQRRNKTECDLYFSRDSNRVEPMEASGVGAVDVAAFALRASSWSMMTPHTDNVLLLDEPFKHLKGLDANIRVLQIAREISRKLGIQIIMVSDERIPREDTIENADRVFDVSIKNGISKIKVS